MFPKDEINIQLREQRKQRNWTQTKVAEAIGVTDQTVGRWERGETTPPPYYRKKLCDLFEIPPETLEASRKISSVKVSVKREEEDTQQFLHSQQTEEDVSERGTIPEEPRAPRSPKEMRFLRFSFAFLALLVVFGVITYAIRASPRHLAPSSTPLSRPITVSTLIPNRQPIVDDPLNNENASSQWDTGTQGGGIKCTFEGESYHISAPAGLPGGGCNPEASPMLTNFVYQITMVINQGRDRQLRAGPDFCWNPGMSHGSVYEVTFNTQGTWYFERLTEATTGSALYTPILTGNSRSFQTGIGQINTLTMRMLKDHIDVQVNGKLLFSTVVRQLCEGQIGVALRPGTEDATVAFHDAKVWQL